MATVTGIPLAQWPDRAQWVGVIGSRQASAAERAMAHQFGVLCARQGRVVVSGLALGIDGAAHAGALSVPEGRTIAIVSTAPAERIYPPQHQDLAHRIRTQGTIWHPFTTLATSSAQRIHRLLERDLLLAQQVSVIVVVADREPIGGGSRWAVREGERRGIPVFRLDSQGHFHKNPLALDCAVTWDLECRDFADRISVLAAGI